MVARSAGILLFQVEAGALRCLLVHPGGPFWARKDLGVWSIVKGEYPPGDDPEAVARREFEEETGARVEAELLPLGEAAQSSRKVVTAFAAEQDFDCARLVSNTCTLEWPPRSGRMLSVPEVDRAEWFSPEVAQQKILKGQAVFLERLVRSLEDRLNQASRSAFSE